MAASGTRTSRILQEVRNALDWVARANLVLVIEKALAEQGNIHLADLAQIVKPQAKCDFGGHLLHIPSLMRSLFSYSPG